LSFLVRDEWVNAPAGSFILVPGGVTHTFENRGDTRAGALNISVPGDFEERMPAIADWFLQRPAAEAGGGAAAPPGRQTHGVQFSPELRERVADGTITVSYRLWSRPKV